MPTSIRHAWRSLRRTPVFTAAAGFTLVIGIGACVAMFAVINGVLLKPLPYGNPDRLVGVWHDLSTVGISKGQHTVGTYFTYKEFARSIENIGLYAESAVNAATGNGSDTPQRLSAAYITHTLVPTLQVSPILGRSFDESEDTPRAPLVVMISEGLWRTQFGGERDVIGRMIEVNGRQRQIVGVMPARFRFPNMTTQIWLPLQLDPHDEFTGGFNYNGIARLKPGVDVEQATRDLVSVLPRMIERFPNLAPGIPTSMLLEQAKPRPFVIPLKDDVTSGISRTLWMVGAAAALVLLVACANVANLILVRADGRQRELAVREALGAGRARVLGHFLAESGILALMASVVGVGVAWAALRALVAYAPAEIPRLAELRIDAVTIGFTVVVALLVATICSVIPALRIGRVQLSQALREGGRSGTAGKAQQRLRGAMVVVQIALALVVLAVSALLLRTFERLHAVRPGFDATDVATFWVSLPGARYPTDTSIVRFIDQLTTRAGGLAGVRSVGVTSRLPLLSTGMNQNPFYVEGDASSLSKIPPLQLYTTVDAGYFKTLNIPLIAGRTFERLGVQRSDEAIISQRTAERFWNDPTGRAAIGKRFRGLPTGPAYTIVGVVGTVQDTSLASPPSETVYYPLALAPDTLFSQMERTLALVVKTTGDPSTLVPAVQRIVRELDPTLPLYDVRSMQAVLATSTARLSFTIILLAAAAVMTLLLGAIGLYGVMAYLVTLRQRELGVRIALGAEPRSVALMMTNQGLLLAAIGVGAGLVLFALTARFLRSFLFGVTPSDPLTLAAATATLIAIAALASWIPARRAARVDPANSLRAE